MKYVRVFTGAFAAAMLFVGALTGAAIAQTRILTIELNPTGAELAAIFFNGRPGRILTTSGTLNFISVDGGGGGGGGFECKNSIAISTTGGRTASQRADVCENNWQVAFDFRDQGAGASVRTITLTPADPEVRLLALSLDGAPQPFTATAANNRVQFDIRRGPSGFECSRRVEALLSNGETYSRQTDLCAGNGEVIIDTAPVGFYEVLVVRAPPPARITDVSIEGVNSSIVSIIADGVRVRIIAEAEGIACNAHLIVTFADGSTSDTEVNICEADFDVLVAPAALFETDIEVGAPNAWRYIPSNEPTVPARLVYDRPGRLTPVFAASCLPGSARADLFFAAFPQRGALGARRTVSLSAGNFSDTVQGETGNLAGTNAARIPSVHLRTSSPLWAGLIAGLEFEVIVDDRDRVNYSLRGSAGPVRAFVANCNQTPRPAGPPLIGDVSGDGDLSWSFAPATGNRPPRLIFGNADGSRIGLEAVCGVNNGGTQIAIYAMPPRLQPGVNATVTWNAGGPWVGNLQVRTRTVTGADWGAIPMANPALDDSFFTGLIAGRTLALSYNGTLTTRFSLSGSATPVRNFLASCRFAGNEQFQPGPDNNQGGDHPENQNQGNLGQGGNQDGGNQDGGNQDNGDAGVAIALDAFRTMFELFQNAQQNPPANPGGGGGGGPAPDPAEIALANYAARPAYTCGIRDDLGVPTGVATRTTFRNNRANPVRLFSRSTGNGRVLVATIAAGARARVNTTLGQGWEITNLAGRCLTTFVSPRRPAEMVIPANVGRPDPDVTGRTYACSNGEEVAVLHEPNRTRALIADTYPMQWITNDRGPRFVWGASSAEFDNANLKLWVRGDLKLNCRVP